MSGSQPRVLVVEDEQDMAETIRDNLCAEGYEVDAVGDGEAALEAVGEHSYDLVVLDVMLPRRDGYTVCERMRRDGVEAPVLFLTARGSTADKIRGLESGGDDYLAKPFHLRELLLRATALVRRGAAVTPEPQVRFGDNRYDVATGQATAWDGGIQRLPVREARVLELFIDRSDERLSRDEILDHAWGDDVRPSSRTVEVLVRRLRRRFERDPESPRHFLSESRFEYRFVRHPRGGADA